MLVYFSEGCTWKFFRGLYVSEMKANPDLVNIIKSYRFLSANQNQAAGGLPWMQQHLLEIAALVHWYKLFDWLPVKYLFTFVQSGS